MGLVLFGLGNPGREYAATRHNVGFQVLDLLAERHGAAFRATRLVHGEVADLRLPPGRAEGRASGPVRLVKPHSFMNLCGPVYARTLQVFEAEAADALVLVDDFMLPFGRLRLRADGSAGGHNGLKSIEATLATRIYPRLRVGIGPCPAQVDSAAWVLQRYDAEQRKGLPEVLARAAEATLAWVEGGMEAAMRRFNAGPESAAAAPGGGRDGGKDGRRDGGKPAPGPGATGATAVERRREKPAPGGSGDASGGEAPRPPIGGGEPIR